MADEMGILRTDIEIESPLREGDRRLLREVLVDTGAELSWAPAAVLESLGIRRRKPIRFQQADGTVLERWVGFAIVHAGGTFTNDEVVFGEPGDLTLLGARSLEGLNLKVDLVGKRLVSAGPMLAALTAFTTASHNRPLAKDVRADGGYAERRRTFSRSIVGPTCPRESRTGRTFPQSRSRHTLGLRRSVGLWSWPSWCRCRGSCWPKLARASPRSARAMSRPPRRFPARASRTVS